MKIFIYIYLSNQVVKLQHIPMRSYIVHINLKSMLSKKNHKKSLQNQKTNPIHYIEREK